MRIECARKRAKKLPEALPPIDRLEISIFDPNTRLTEKIEVPVTFLPKSNLLFKLCAQDYITSHKDSSRKLIERVSIDFDVLS